MSIWNTLLVGLLIGVSCIGVKWSHGVLLGQSIDLAAAKPVTQYDNTRRNESLRDVSVVGESLLRHRIAADVHNKPLSHSNPFLPVTLESLSEPKQPVLNQTAFTTKTKLKVVFLIDNSKSMAYNDPENHRFYSVVQLFKTDAVQNNVDEAAVIVFSNEAQVLIPFTRASNVASRLKKNLAADKVDFFSQGKTDINAPFEVLKKELLTRDKLINRKGQLAVIFLSDGVATLPYEQAHLFLQKHHIPIFTIGYNIFKSTQQTKQASQTTHASSVQKNSSPQPNNNDFNEKFLRVLAESAADNKGRKGQYLAASEKSISLVYQELLQTISNRLTSLRISILKKTYAPNELLVIRYGFAAAGARNNLSSTDHLALRDCYVTGDAVLRADSAEVGYSNIETLRSVEQVKYLTASIPLTRFNPPATARSKVVSKREPHKKANLPEIMFYPLPQGRYNVTVRLKCSAFAEVKQKFTMTFTETALPLQITDALYFMTGTPYPKEDYFNVYAYKDLSVWGFYYHLAEAVEKKGLNRPRVQDYSTSAYTKSFAVSFPESQYLLRAGERKLQPYRIALKPNDLLDDMPQNKNRYRERIAYHDNSSNDYSRDNGSGGNRNNENVFADPKFSVPLTHRRMHHISDHTKPKIITASSSSGSSNAPLEEISSAKKARSEHGFIEIVTSEGRYLYHTFIEMTSASGGREGFIGSALIKPVQRYYSPMKKVTKNSSTRGHVSNNLVLQLTLGILIGMMISISLIGLRYLWLRVVRSQLNFSLPSPTSSAISYLSKRVNDKSKKPSPFT